VCSPGLFIVVRVGGGECRVFTLSCAVLIGLPCALLSRALSTLVLHGQRKVRLNNFIPCPALGYLLPKTLRRIKPSAAPTLPADVTSHAQQNRRHFRPQDPWPLFRRRAYCVGDDTRSQNFKLLCVMDASARYAETPTTDASAQTSSAGVEDDQLISKTFWTHACKTLRRSGHFSPEFERKRVAVVGVVKNRGDPCSMHISRGENERISASLQLYRGRVTLSTRDNDARPTDGRCSRLVRLSGDSVC